MLLVGLTGGIASGKSTVARRLAEHGAAVVDADLVAREVVEPGEPAFHEIVEHFGEQVVGDDGRLDRAALGAIVFADPEQRAELERITHPRVAEAIARRLADVNDGRREQIVVLDVPLLVEAGIDRDYDAIVVVATQPETQVQRLVEQRGMPAEDARARVAAEADLEAKLAVATHVVHNEGTLDELRERVDELHDELVALAAAQPGIST